jgi:hypothetical protein
VNWKIQVVVILEDGSQETRAIQTIERNDLKPETLGLTLAEGKAILKDIVTWHLIRRLRTKRQKNGM